MKKVSIIWKDYVAWGLMLLSALVLLIAVNVTATPGDTDQAAERMGHILDRRMGMLEGYIATAMETPVDEWPDLEGLPEDMVVYRYVDDTLQSWVNTFAMYNDDISSRHVYQVIGNPLNSLASPLAEIGEETSFVNLGQKWYLARSCSEGPVRVIAGMEIKNPLGSRSANEVNPRLHLGDKFSVKPLTFSEGSAVYVGGQPHFKVLQETLKKSSATDSLMVWLSLLVFLSALLLAFSAHRNLKFFSAVVASMAGAFAWMFLWGARVENEAPIFSPTLFADGPFLYSLGAVLVLNLFILVLSLSLYLVRRDIYSFICSRKHSKVVLAVLSLAALVAVPLILAYTHIAFSSIVRNSNITLELYKMGDLSKFTFIVYLSFITMLMSVPVLVQLCRPLAKELFNLRYDAFSPTGLTLFSLLAGVYFVVTAGLLGFRKEQNRAEVWANRLSVERDITLELKLRLVEGSIANDAFIASLSVLPNAGNVVLNRIVDNYMYNIAQDYDISVLLFDSEQQDPNLLSYFNERVRKGTAIHPLSRFMYTSSLSGQPRYTALFTFISGSYGLSYMLLGVEPKTNRDYRGYASLLEITDPGRVVLPAGYSYGRYEAGKLVSYKGSYAYPTVMTEDLYRRVFDNHEVHILLDGYSHFAESVGEDEAVIVSRQKESLMSYVVAGVFLSLVTYILLSLVTVTRKRRRAKEKSYYKTRITVVTMVSLILTLVVMAVVSVVFVYERNDANKKEMMSDRINSLQTMLSAVCRYAPDYTALNVQELTSAMESAVNMSKADITLYSMSGKAFKTTNSEVFDRMLISNRIDSRAYRSIVYQNKRYYINREKLGTHSYYALYAPLFNDDGDMIAILCTPYTDENYDFEMQAVMHSVTILTVFMILLILARFTVSKVVDRMFKPLVEMGKKMNSPDVDSLEYIDYDRDDEISTLVGTYNRMVHDLRESTRERAQAERDKAWSSMARQVAHEIKNPLTPMKLQMQRIIRMKQRNLPGWEDKFDEASRIVLDHIDILSDTANEFSTFAKLYSEEPTRIDIDAMLQEEIAMFDNKENIEFSYMGLPGSEAMGPKPQLTRVFVNLITNSVQAIEIAQQEAAERGETPEAGRVNVSLRLSSTREDCFDIVFEDNGPGVPAENQNKLFTPNFTTKSSGTGLGLAICRSILEKCSADISYSRSFTLEGACFTIRYPRG